jgi:hypothetical protein
VWGLYHDRSFKLRAKGEMYSTTYLYCKRIPSHKHLTINKRNIEYLHRLPQSIFTGFPQIGVGRGAGTVVWRVPAQHPLFVNTSHTSTSTELHKKPQTSEIRRVVVVEESASNSDGSLSHKDPFEHANVFRTCRCFLGSVGVNVFSH